MRIYRINSWGLQLLFVLCHILFIPPFSLFLSLSLTLSKYIFLSQTHSHSETHSKNLHNFIKKPCRNIHILVDSEYLHIFFTATDKKKICLDFSLNNTNKSNTSLFIGENNGASFLHSCILLLSKILNNNEIS